MTAEEHADSLIAKYGLPQRRDQFHALLCFIYQQGKVDGANEAATALRETFGTARPASSAAAEQK